DRYEIRLRASVFATQREISEEKPDALILDEDDSEDAAYDLLDWLSRELRSPVVVVVSSTRDRPSLATLFGVPLVHKPIKAEELVATIEVAIEQRLSPVPRRIGE